ncbi:MULTISPECIES: MFS transporter [unclassified Frigoribacterium]|uniref:MFS transporter n=1 Tax=unclassified Frigoribacterium TaxID=2627005 RepID=UPI000F492847|nr:MULTISPECIES: MFS transporter [unclassified Frigoribacterium]ROP78841.1 sugar phosphate permease [Frigoribacterium sp. PhB107]ROS48913.1 sugar phosphate permease [Frigoribacterium sp. PhB24]ROS61124.1 sugar phosphate permease [Frigoribacterium sp. PhB160]
MTDAPGKHPAPRPATDHPVPELPLSAAGNLEIGAEQISEGLRESGESERPKFRKGYLALLFLAQFTLYLAFVAPIAYSLAVRIDQIAPDSRNSLLALAAGIPGILVVVLMPLVGMLSDRTRSRFGRRRPWLVGGVLLGLIGSIAIGFTDTPFALIAGWSIAYVGYSTSAAMIVNHLADKLPEQQRGRVTGIIGAINQIAPLFGVVLGGVLASTGAGLFLYPGIIAFVGMTIFAIAMRDPRVTAPRVTSSPKQILRGFYFNPKRYPNLAWVFLSRAFVFLALSFSLYNVYLLQDRLGLSPAEVAQLVSLSGILSIVGGIGGAMGSGWLSDKLKTRKPFLLVSGIVIGIGLVGTGTTASIPQYVVASLLTAFGIGVYGAVDQALALDVLPKDEDENGRYLSLLQLASSIPQAAGAFLAGGILALFSGEYTAVFIAGAICAVLGALAILPISVGRRAELSTTSVTVPR